MIIAKLINPQIIYNTSGEKISFDNTLIFKQDGVELKRTSINLPYAMPDHDIEVMVKQMAVDKAKDIAREEAYAVHSASQKEANPDITEEDILSSFVFEEPDVATQDTLQWDWPLFDMPEEEPE